MKDKWQPTQKQRDFVQGLVSGKSINKAAEYAGCSRYSYFKRWSKDQRFLTYLQSRRREEAGAKLPKIDRAILQKAAEGDVQAARLCYEAFDGLRDPKPEVDVSYRPPEGEAPAAKVLSLLDNLEKKREADASEK